MAAAIGYAMFQAGFSLAAVNFVTIGAGAAIVNTAILIGASAALAAATSSGPAARSGINAPELRGIVRRARPPQRVIYGTNVRTSGALFFEKNVPPWQYVGLALSRRPCTLKRTLIGTVPVAFDPVGNAATAPWGVGSNIFLSRSWRDGTHDYPDPLLAADFPDLDPNYRQLGAACAVMKAHYGDDIEHHERLWGLNLIPNYQFDVEGAPVYDPREAGQNRDDPSTWRPSDTGALVQADYLRADFGGRVPGDQIDWDVVARKADEDEDLIALKGGGVHKRYTINGIVQLNQRPRDVIDAMTRANRGFVLQARGKVGIGGWRKLMPAATIGDRDILRGFSFRDAAPRRAVLNRVRTRFVAPDREYETVDGPILDDVDQQLADGEVREATLDLPFTAEHPRAQRLAKARRDDSRGGKTIDGLVLPLRFLGLAAGMRVTVDSRIWPEIGGSYVVRAAGMTDDFSAVAASLAEYDPAIGMNWRASVDEKDWTVADVLGEEAEAA